MLSHETIKSLINFVQEFISFACIEHLDFLDMDTDVENIFNPFKEKDEGKQFRSFTDIPRLSKIDVTEAWVQSKVWKCL